MGKTVAMELNTGKTNVRDMTQGSITGHLTAFALPMLAGNIFQQLYNMVDSIIVGRFVGADALGAVGSIGSLTFLFFSLCLGLASGVGILVSQYFGAGEEDEVKKCIGQSVYVILTAGFLMSFISAFFAKQILVMMKTPEETFEYALLYMQIVCGGIFIVAIYNGVSAILRALGDSKTPLHFLIVSSVLNIVLDIVFVKGFGMAVLGVALATVISQAVSAVGVLIVGIKKNPYFHIHKESMALDMNMIGREVRMGLPLAAQNATIAISVVVLQGVINSFGSVAMAAYTASNRIEQLVQQPYSSLGIAMSTFSGQNFGAKDKNRIHRASYVGLVMIAVFSLIMVIVMYAFGGTIVGIFTSQQAVIDIGVKGLRLTSTMYFFLGLIYIMRGLLNGVGDVTFSMMNGISEVICRIGIAYLLIGFFTMDYMAVWYANGLTWTIVGIMSIIRFYVGNWKDKII